MRSRRGDNQLRGLLYEAAAVILNRSTDTSSLRTWALELKDRIGFKRAAVALARKLAVIMHAMLRTGELFDPHEQTLRSTCARRDLTFPVVNVRRRRSPGQTWISLMI